MFDAAVALTVLTSGIVVKICKKKRIAVSERIRDNSYLLLKGVLLLYLADFVLLRWFSIPITVLHEGTAAGIICSFMVMLVVLINLAVFYTDFRDNRTGRFFDVTMSGFGVTLLWLFIEIVNLMLKINP